MQPPGNTLASRKGTTSSTDSGRPMITGGRVDFTRKFAIGIYFNTTIFRDSDRSPRVSV